MAQGCSEGRHLMNDWAEGRYQRSPLPTPLVVPRKKRQHKKSQSVSTLEQRARRQRLDLPGDAAKAQRFRLYKKQRGLCWWCGLPMKLEEATREHVYPLSRFATRTVANQDWNVKIVHDNTDCKDQSWKGKR